ncbi:MAG: penicillin-binding protein 2, partial [Candidatus Omnitrophica bacterium]|nr:penicillin-binding protein 2 [Candidatus Omnitrophota bacterium]
MQSNTRLYLLVFFIVLVGFALIFRLFSLQVLRYDFYKELAANQHQTHQILFPKRGEIFIKDRFYGKDPSSQLFPLAVNREWPMVYAIPREIENREEVVKILAPLLEIDEEILRKKINKRNDPYEPLKHKLSQDIVEKIKRLNIKGIEFTIEDWRHFPANSLASHVVGFVGFSNDTKVGQYGIEEYYNKELEGKYGFLDGEKDPRGRLIAIAKRYLQPAEDGVNLILTIDSNIQFFIEKKLQEVAERLDAEGGTIIVINPKTGAIKAMANWPAFNPNKYSEIEDFNIFLNPATHNLFEPGSIFKPITMAIALDKKLLSPGTTYEDKGFVKIGGYTIRNSHDEPEGIQTMTQVLEKSLNTGAVFIQQLIGKKVFKNYLEKFRLSKKTGIDLEGETKGNISNLNTRGDIEYATASFGQGIAITPMELVVALGAIANEGRLMKPYLVEKFIYPDGREETTEPKVIDQVISSETAEKLTKMMVSVVENGYGKKAGVPGYFIAGKTGTAQVPE